MTCRSSLVLALLLVASGCSTPTGRFRTSSFDGVEIAYDVSGQLSPTLVFVHGWLCERSHWRSQIAHFEGSYRTVSLDLGGHGESGADRAEWNLPGFARDVVAVVKQIDGPVVLIGHSMGGPVACLAASRLGDRVLGVVAVDTFHDADEILSERDLSGIIERLDRDYPDTCEQFVRHSFSPGADSALIESVIAGTRRSTPTIAVAVMRSYIGFDMAETLRACPASVYCINSAETKSTNLAGNRKHAPGFQVIEMSGVGHFPMLEKPYEFNRHLERALSHFAAERVGS